MSGLRKKIAETEETYHYDTVVYDSAKPEFSQQGQAKIGELQGSGGQIRADITIEESIHLVLMMNDATFKIFQETHEHFDPSTEAYDAIEPWIKGDGSLKDCEFEGGEATWPDKNSPGTGKRHEATFNVYVYSDLPKDDSIQEED